MKERTHFDVVIENAYRPTDGKRNLDRFTVGTIPVNKARDLFRGCYAAFGWAISFDEMELEKHGAFIVWSSEVSDTCFYMQELPGLIRAATDSKSYDCLFSIGFSIQGCGKKDGEDLDCTDFRAAIERRMADLDTSGNLEWLEAIKCHESVEEVEGMV